MKEAINLAGRLFLIAAVAALVLAVVNSITAPVIEANSQEQLKDSLGVAYPEGETFEPIDESISSQYTGEGSPINEIYEVDGGEGYVYNVSAPGGYNGNIDFIVGIKDGVFTGFSVLAHSETPGFGAAVTEDEFAQGVTETQATGEVESSADGSGENEIVAISGSTITTDAVLGGLNEAVQVNSEIAQ